MSIDFSRFGILLYFPPSPSSFQRPHHFRPPLSPPLLYLPLSPSLRRIHPLRRNELLSTTTTTHLQQTSQEPSTFIDVVQVV